MDMVDDESPVELEKSVATDVNSEISNSSKSSSVLKVKCLCNSSNCRGWLIV